jgi:hypothetical protein
LAPIGYTIFRSKKNVSSVEGGSEHEKGFLKKDLPE